MERKFEMLPKVPAEKESKEFEVVGEIEQAIDTVLSSASAERLDEIAKMEINSQQKNEAIAAFAQLTVLELEKIYGLERSSDPRHFGLALSEEKLHQFIVRYPDELIKKVIKNKLENIYQQTT
jgi:hypothetical protein